MRQQNYLMLDELVAMEEPSTFAALFPAEKAALAELWSIFEVPGSDNLVTPLSVPTVTDASVAPSAMAWAAPLDCNALNDDEAAVCARVQLVADDDGDPNTLSTADVDIALTEFAQLFVTEELWILNDLQAQLHEQALSNADALLVMPEAETATIALGPAVLTVATAPDLRSRHSVGKDLHSAAIGPLEMWLETHYRLTEVSAPNDIVVVLLDPL